MKLSLVLFASLPLLSATFAGEVLAQDTSAGDPEVFFEVPVAELVPETPEGSGIRPWGYSVREAMRPYVVLEGEGEAYYRDPRDQSISLSAPADRSGRVYIRVPEAREVRGRLFLPTASWDSMVAYEFALPAERATAGRAEFLRAEAEHLRRLVWRRVAGTAWFRHRLDSVLRELGEEAAPEPGNDPWRVRPSRGDVESSYELFSGARALSENLQLDRLLPISEAEEETVALDSIEGIEVRAFDWGPLLPAEPPALDPLAAFVPADQHALFFPSFRAFATQRVEAEQGEHLLAGLDQGGMALASANARIEAQLVLPWNALVRTFGERAVKSIAVTASDPYFADGTDVCVLFETGEPDALLALLEGLRRAAAPKTEFVSGTVGSVAWSGVETQGRSVSSFAAAHGNVVVVTNSRMQLERVLRAGLGESARLVDLDEYVFFRARYPLERDSLERAASLLVVPDEAIRRWCGPRWRIGASRRVQAGAVLADLQAGNLDALVEGRQVRMRPDPRYPLGGLQLLEDRVHSSEYGTLDFLTPIRELELERVGKNEAALYENWRRGYQSAWSNFFDPIAIEITVAEDEVRADVSVLPLIDFSEYDWLRDLAGEQRLAALDGDPHPEALVQFVMALDKESRPVKEYGALAGGMLGISGPDALSWMGEYVTVYFDHDQALFDRITGDEPFDADVFFDDWNAIPVALTLDVTSGLKLVAFLTALRGMVEQTAPNMVTWHQEQEGEHRFVRIASTEGAGMDVALYYAASADAWILSPHRPTLLRALDRAAARAQGEAEEAPAPWAGQSAGFTIDRRGIDLLEALGENELGDNLRRLAWDKLPILDEWKRRYPDQDPVAFHERWWGERLVDPGGGAYRWNAETGSMESSLFGSPVKPGEGVSLPPGLAGFQRGTFGLTFEHDGLRAVGSLGR